LPNNPEFINAENGDMIAIIVRAEYEVKESHFITLENALQNVGFFTYKEGHIVKPHYHPNLQRTIYGTPEVVIMKAGKLKLLLFDNSQKFVKEVIIKKDDMFILISGGHGEEMLEDTTVLVVKQGPYIQHGEKVYFEGEI